MYVTATQWTVDKDATPLRYAFGKVVGGVCVVWAAPSDSLEWKDIMPAGSPPNNILTLCVIVEDKFGSFAMAKVNITSNPPAALSPDAVDDLLSSAVEAQLKSGNADRALSAMSNIAGTVQGSSNASGN